MKISIIGAGRLGGLIAFLIADRGLVDEIVLVDVNRQLAEGQALDLRHASLGGTKTIKIYAGDYASIAGSSIVIITAGMPRTASMASRSELLIQNARIIKEICANIKPLCKGSIIVSTTNPVDVMNYLIYKETGFERKKVIGFGGILDSARLKLIISEELNVSPSSVLCEVIGEHGENMVPIFSGLKNPLTAVQKEKVSDRLLHSSKEVIIRKGATEYGPASHILRLIDSIANDRKYLLPCSCILEGEYGARDVSVGVHATIGRSGVEKIKELALEDEERDALGRAIEKVRSELSTIMYST